jgi:hypothetical protein
MAKAGLTNLGIPTIPSINVPPRVGVGKELSRFKLKAKRILRKSKEKNKVRRKSLSLGFRASIKPMNLSSKV